MASSRETVREASPASGQGAAEFRAALEEALRLAADDERTRALLGSARLRLRLRFPDVGLVLNVRATGDQRLEWTFGDVEWEPKLELTMNSDVGNRYLQGRESLPIALARGRARCSGDSTVALLYLPAARLLCEPYRRVVRSHYPGLAAA